MEIKESYPLVSIGIPTYNSSDRIRTALTSISEQKYPNLEIIISDNCSTDNTQEVIQEICKSHPEIKYFRQQTNIGMIQNFDFVLRRSSGKYYMWVSDDDMLEPGALLKYVAFLENNPDYSLASGEIRYWKDDVPDLIERGFSFEQNVRSMRVIGFYFTVVYGGLVHGLMRRELTRDVAIRLIIGNDYHFVANLAYMGKIKNFDFIGYNKTFGGTSKNFQEYAKAMGESKFAGYFPHIKMAYDAYAEVMHRSPVYTQTSLFYRFPLAIASFSGIMFRYYVRIFPFAVGSQIRSFLMKTFGRGTRLSLLF